MEYARQPLLSAEMEEKLKAELKPKWLSGMTGADISKKLKFGEQGSPYEKLKPSYVYFYRQKFNLPTRKEPSFAQGTRRYKHKPKELGLMSPEMFVKQLNTKLPIPKLNSFHIRRKRTYLILHYWTPLRASEIYERSAKDFEITQSKVIIHLLRKKKRVHNDDDEPISIPRAFPLVEEVVSWLEDKKWDTELNAEQRPWNISRQTAQNYVNEVFKNYYPHFFRFNFITNTTKVPDMRISELKAKTYLTLSAIEKYVFTPEGEEDELDRRKAEQMKASGVMQ